MKVLILEFVLYFDSENCRGYKGIVFQNALKEKPKSSSCFKRSKYTILCDVGEGKMKLERFRNFDGILLPFERPKVFRWQEYQKNTGVSKKTKAISLYKYIDMAF
ncbi:MAG TPA: hypothetical protein VFD35_08245 [Pricia sp.]|nr:hypothetical protein [Pricia sp.]